MKHEARAVIHMEKLLLTAISWAGMESQGISRARQTVIARLMESQIWLPLAASVAVWGKGSEKAQ